MDEQETPQLWSDEHVQPKEKWYAPLTRITPLSKVLAMALFIILPFVGFWLGVGHGEFTQATDPYHSSQYEMPNGAGISEKPTPEEFLASHRSCNVDLDCVLVREALGCCSPGYPIRKDALGNYLNMFDEKIVDERTHCARQQERGLECAFMWYEPVCVEQQCMAKDMMRGGAIVESE